MLGVPVHFDDDRSRSSQSDASVPAGGVPRALRNAAESVGIDPLAELYNEALRFATEGHLREARERLLMLICLDPEDAEARLLLAKVHVAGQKWKEALSALDEASSLGLKVPKELRRAVEDHLHAEVATEEEQRAALRAREQGEIRALRQEARRLRSENAQLLNRSSGLEQEVRRWAWTAGGVSVVAILFTLTTFLSSSGSSSTPVVAAEVAESAAPTEQAVPLVGEPGPVEAASPEAPPPVEDLAARAQRVLEQAPDLNGTFAVTVKGGEASVSGEVRTAAERRRVKAILEEVRGLSAVSVDGLEVTARTRGARHTVSSGDMLSKIAYRYYGDSQLIAPIRKANASLSKSTSLSIGQELVIPPVE